MDWSVVPTGLREMLLWISKRYNNPLLFITENGSAEVELNVETSLHDDKRRKYFEGHIQACAEAIQNGGVNLSGYFAWSLMDNFEWQFGYQRRFGLCRVDYDTMERTPRESALWYRDTIRANGRNIQLGGTIENAESGRFLNERAIRRSIPRSRTLPAKVLIGYGSECDAVHRAIYDGVNIVIWSFLDVRVSPDRNDMSPVRRLDDKSASTGLSLSQRRTTVSTNLNLTAIRDLIDELDHSGFGHVLHFASVGGWNGAHLNAAITAHEWYLTFNDSVGDVFDGIDWDLEGNDQMISSDNFFTVECLDKMGDISRLAKEGTCVYTLFWMLHHPRGRLTLAHHVRLPSFGRRSIHQHSAAAVLSGHWQQAIQSLCQPDGH